MATKWLERSPAALAFEDGKDMIRQRIRAALRPVNNRIMTMWSDEFNKAWTADGTIMRLTDTGGVDRMLMLAVVQEYGGDEAVDLLVSAFSDLEEAARVLRAGEPE